MTLKDQIKSLIPECILKPYYRLRNPQMRPTPARIGACDVLFAQDGSDAIFSGLAKGKPFSCIRFGWGELSAVLYWMEYRDVWTPAFSEKIRKNMTFNAGFFPDDDEALTRFCRESLEIAKRTDIIGVTNRRGDDRIISELPEKPVIVDIACIGDMLAFQDRPWTRCLRGKRVLVIHPFEDTIRKQYAKRELLFANPDTLPEFELLTLKSVQSAAGAASSLPYADWFEALDSMYRKIDALEFDVALVGAGAYGMFLTDYCKRTGRQAVHMGGALQLLFGILGNRWEKEYPPEFGTKLFNEHWVRPGAAERPSMADGVENACYW